MVLVRAVSAGAALTPVASAAVAAAVAGVSHPCSLQRTDGPSSSSSRIQRQNSAEQVRQSHHGTRDRRHSLGSALKSLSGGGHRVRRTSDAFPPNGMSSRRPFHSTSRAQASVRDPYATLGVKKDASAKEIKGAYYDLAKKFHPDTSKEKGAKERFVEIQTAYDILSDDKKKAAFDRYGTTDGQPGFNPFGGGAGGGGPGFDPFGGGGGGFGGFGGFQGGARDASDIFEGLFGAAFSGRGRTSGAGFAGETRGEDIDTNINISFEEACRGASKRVTISPVERCSTCEGRGLKKDRHKRTCGVCNGTGTRTFVIQSGFQMASTCPACNGAGETVASGDECGTCEGVGRVRTRKTVDVKVPAGVDDGAKIRMDGQGDVPLQGAGSPGSLYVRISVRPSKVWRRQGSNLYYPATVPFHTAILGGRVRVPTLDGDVDVRVPSGTQVGDEMLLRGRGVPRLLGRGEKGDLLVQFEVQIPRSLTKRQREILQQYVDDIEGRTSAPSATSTPPPPPPPQPSASAQAPGGAETSSSSAASPSDSSTFQPSKDEKAKKDTDRATEMKGESRGYASGGSSGSGSGSTLGGSSRAEQAQSRPPRAAERPASAKDQPQRHEDSPQEDDKGVLGKTWDWLRGR